MKPIRFSTEVNRRLRKIQKTDHKLFKKIKKQITLFKNNPQHKSLRLHKITGVAHSIKSISIDRNIRILFEEDGDFYFFAIGTLDEVYKK